MKALLLAAFIITLGLASCTVTEPNDGYYSQQRVYNNPYGYDPYAGPVYDSRYSTRRVYDYNTGRYYDVPAYSNQTYRKDNYRRDNYRRDNNRRDNVRRDSYRETQQPRYVQPRNQPNVQPQEKRLPDGTRISPDGTVTLPNGQVKRN